MTTKISLLGSTQVVGWTDAGISRGAAGTVDVGNGTAGDTSGGLLAASINKVAVTAPATSATLTIANGKTLTSSVSMTLQGGDASVLSIAASKTLTASVSMTLQGGDASVLSIAAGKTLTASTSGTLGGGDAWVLAIAAGKTLAVSNNLTLAGTDGTTITFGSASSSFPIVTNPSGAILQLGAADAASPVAQTLQVQSVVAGTTDTAGTDWTLTGSKGTGSGNPGNIVIKTSSKGNSTATTQNAAATVATFGPSSNLSATNVPALDIAQTWNNAGLAGTALKVNVTNTSSASGNIIDLQVGGVSKFAVNSFGLITTAGSQGAQISGSVNAASYSMNGDTFITRSAAASLQLGAADAASPVAQTLQVQSVVGTTTNTAGVNWTMNASVGTGSGAGGQLIHQTAPAGGASRTASSVTCTSASPGVFTLNSHGLAVGQPFTLGGTPPTGYSLSTTYYVCNDANYGTNTFTGSTSLANALAGTAITTSSTGTSVTLTTGQNGLVPGLTLTSPATFSNASSRTQIGFPSTVIGYQSALATTATDGFLYIPTCSGTPTGTPTSFTGKVALIYDTAGDIFWIYRSGWKQPKTVGTVLSVVWS